MIEYPVIVVYQALIGCGQKEKKVSMAVFSWKWSEVE